jgi:hypothetical protein
MDEPRLYRVMFRCVPCGCSVIISSLPVLDDLPPRPCANCKQPMTVARKERMERQPMVH